MALKVTPWSVPGSTKKGEMPWSAPGVGLEAVGWGGQWRRGGAVVVRGWVDLHEVMLQSDRRERPDLGKGKVCQHQLGETRCQFARGHEVLLVDEAANIVQTSMSQHPPTTDTSPSQSLGTSTEEAPTRARIILHAAADGDKVERLVLGDEHGLLVGGQGRDRGAGVAEVVPPARMVRERGSDRRGGCGGCEEGDEGC